MTMSRDAIPSDCPHRDNPHGEGLSPLPIVVICGPTAIGKSDVAVALAVHIEGEIVCADSRTLYRGMDIGAAKPSCDARARVPHHLLDVADPDAAFTVSDFQRLAREAIVGIRARRRFPLLVGGSGFYIRAVVDDVRFPAVPPDWSLRNALEAQEAATPGTLHECLAHLDPVTAAAIHPANVRRVIRALEVIAHVGVPVSEQRRSGRPEDAIWFGLTMAQAALHARIEARAAAQVAAGLVDEVQALLARGVPPEAPAMQGIGYKEMIDVARGRTPLDEAFALLVRSTRRYAKRQYTWFRAERRVTWIDATAATPAEIADWMAARVDGRAAFAR